MNKIVVEARDISAFGDLDEEDVKPFTSMTVDDRKDNCADHDARALVTDLCQEGRNKTRSVEPAADPCKRLEFN